MGNICGRRNLSLIQEEVLNPGVHFDNVVELTTRDKIIQLVRPKNDEVEPIANDNNLDIIIETLETSVLKADNKARRNALVDLENYFEVDIETKTLTPKMVSIADVDGNMKRIPLYKLVHHETIGMDSIKLVMGFSGNKVLGDRSKPTIAGGGKFQIDINKIGGGYIEINMSKRTTVPDVPLP